MSISDEKSTEAEGRDWDDAPDFDALENKGDFHIQTAKKQSFLEVEG